MINQLYGRSFSHWHHVDTVMAHSGLKTAQDLDAALRRRPEFSQKPTFSIEVRDQSNPSRLLGRLIRKPAEQLDGDLINVAVRPSLMPSFSPLAPEQGFNLSTIRFRVNYRRSLDGYSQVAELLTDTPLGVVMLHPDFRLPGENEKQAQHRRQMASF